MNSHPYTDAQRPRWSRVVSQPSDGPIPWIRVIFHNPKAWAAPVADPSFEPWTDTAYPGMLPAGFERGRYNTYPRP